MSIRIHKVLGYGLTDFKGFEDDKRIHPDFSFNEYYSSLGKEDNEKFKRFFRNEADKIKGREDICDYELEWNFYFDHRSDNKDNLYKISKFDIIHYDEEFSKNIICFTNPIKSDWIRVDDIIDYYENSADNTYKLIRGGIYPLNGLGQNVETGESVKYYLEFIQMESYLVERKEKGEISNEELIDSLNIETNRLFSCSLKTFRKNINNRIDNIIFEYLRFKKIFRDDSEIRRLQSMIYTYWY